MQNLPSQSLIQLSLKVRMMPEVGMDCTAATCSVVLTLSSESAGVGLETGSQAKQIRDLTLSSSSQVPVFLTHLTNASSGFGAPWLHGSCLDKLQGVPISHSTVLLGLSKHPPSF